MGFNPVFYVTLGSGVGGGLVVDGRIYHGAKPGEAEIGHVRLDRQGTIVEARCSGWAVDARIRDLKAKEPGCLLAQLAGQTVGGEAKHLAAAWEQGDAVAKRLLKETAEDLAFGLSHVVHLLHPEVIILGGGLSGVGEPLRAAVEAPCGPSRWRPLPRTENRPGGARRRCGACGGAGIGAAVRVVASASGLWQCRRPSGLSVRRPFMTGQARGSSGRRQAGGLLYLLWRLRFGLTIPAWQPIIAA